MSSSGGSNGTYRRLQERKNSNSVLVNPDTTATLDDNMQEFDHKNSRGPNPQTA